MRGARNGRMRTAKGDRKGGTTKMEWVKVKSADERGAMEDESREDQAY